MTNWLSAEALKLHSRRAAPEGQVLRRTSGALRQTKGKPRPLARRCARKTAPLQAFRSHGAARHLVASKIRCRLKHLCGVPRRCGERVGAARYEISSRVRRLKPVRQNEPHRTLTRLCESCGKLKASNFPCGKAGFFRGGCVAANSSVKNPPAMI